MLVIDLFLGAILIVDPLDGYLIFPPIWQKGTFSELFGASGKGALSTLLPLFNLLGTFSAS